MVKLDYRINTNIKANKVRVIDPDGINQGVLDIAVAINLAKEYDLDLVEISPESNPPVCRITSISKLKYQAQVKEKDIKKKSSKIEVKDIKIRPVIEEHDYQTKINWAKKFIKNGNNIRVTILIKGREASHPILAEKLIDRIALDLKETAIIKGNRTKFGKDIIFLLEPIKK